jgi:subtilase family serine protease
MNIKPSTRVGKTVYLIILIGTIVVALGGGNLITAHAQAPTAGASASVPLIPHPFTFHKPVCPPVNRSGFARCNSEVVTDAAGTLISSDTLLSGSYGPAAFRGAYGVSGSTATNRTVAIVDAYDDPTVLNDLDAYSDNYGIPRLNRCNVSTGTTGHPCIQKVDQNGGTTYPTGTSWSDEIALDVETVHALCQNCNILLVEADDSSYTNLINADQRAYLMGANVVSNSWGGSEFNGETSYDSTFNHPGVVYVFSSGDGGYGVEYPSASPNVTAVGGTTLKVNSDYTYNSETAWSGAGSGCSSQESKPGFQHDKGCPRRTVADVSADADPSTGAAVYITAPGFSGWYQYGGTSLAAPLVAAVFAMAGGVGTTLGNSLPYANLNYGVNLRDVTSGNNGKCSGSYLCTAMTGYDGPTGLGSPLGLSAFTPPPPNHTVTFNSNGGSGTMSPQIANAPTALALNTFFYLGYFFSGWNTLPGGGGTAYSDGAVYSFSADVTLFAQWTVASNTGYLPIFFR